MDAQFAYNDERFADIQLLRYRLPGFEHLTAKQKELIYYLSQATIYGRDITFDQFGKYNLRIRKLLEIIYLDRRGNDSSDDFRALEVYLKRIWFSNGIYHHYGCEKFAPGFSEDYLRQCVHELPEDSLPSSGEMTKEEYIRPLIPVIFNSDVLPKRVNKADGMDLVTTSACNFYEGLTQQEVEDFYDTLKRNSGDEPPSYGLNSTLVKKDGVITEDVWKIDGKYDNAIRHIIFWLKKAKEVADNELQAQSIALLIDYYTTGDLKIFDQYSIQWVKEQQSNIDFVNGFIEVYGDPLALKASWEGIVEYKDMEATIRAKKISDQAQWFEDHSPVDERFKKKTVKGVSASVVCAAMLGGDEYPSTAIGINLPNSDWIRAKYGSKSVTISNLTDAYNKAAKGNGFRQEFVIDEATISLIDTYGDVCDDVHTDLHECLGHGSGQLLPNTDPDALKAYGNTIEEARADLFGLYYMADDKLVEMGVLPDRLAYQSQYYTYLMNGLMTQLSRISSGHQIEEAHMRNRALIARWAMEHSNGNVSLEKINGKTFVRIRDYAALRPVFAKLLAEIQRIKSEGDFEAARALVEKYAVNVDSVLHEEVLERYHKLDLAPYKGFINPVMTPIYDQNGVMCDVKIDYTESYTDQMLRYSSEYATLI